MPPVEQTWGREGAAIKGQVIQLDLSPLSPRQNKSFHLWRERQLSTSGFRVLGKSHFIWEKGIERKILLLGRILAATTLVKCWTWASPVMHTTIKHLLIGCTGRDFHIERISHCFCDMFY